MSTDPMRTRSTVLERAGGKCEGCGAADRAVGIRTRSGMWADAPAGCEPGDWFAGVKCIRIVLKVAHLDHNRANNEPANLKAVCTRCCNRHDAAVRTASRSRRAG